MELDLILTDALVDLVAERIDVALRLGPRPAGDFIISRLAPTTLRLAASPAYLGDAPGIEAPQDIGKHACLISAIQHRGTWIFRRSSLGETDQVSGVIATSNTLVLRRCVLDGVGIAALADWLVDDDIASGRLEAVLPAWQVAVRDFDPGVWVVYPSSSFLPGKTRAFIDHLKAHVRGPS